jgi:ribA/ribD-fused uncharacterized protein
METENAIFFYSKMTESPFVVFSNFTPATFKDVRGNEFNCTEQYFMYKKWETFNNDNIELGNAILAETDPKKIREYGRKIQNFDDDVWTEHRRHHMKIGNCLKYSQNPKLEEILLQSGDKTLYEANPFDNIWGIGFSGEKAQGIDPQMYGTNLLGQILMEIRDEIHEVKRRRYNFANYIDIGENETTEEVEL